MTYRTVTVRPKLSGGQISVTASVSKNVSVAAKMTTAIRHYDTDYDSYEGGYTVAPDWEAQTLNTKDKVLHENMTVEGIYINSAQNPAGGNTVYIGGQVNG